MEAGEEGAKARRRRERGDDAARREPEATGSMEAVIDGFFGQTFPSLKRHFPGVSHGVASYAGEFIESIFSGLVATETPLPDWLAAFTFVLVERLYGIWTSAFSSSVTSDEDVAKMTKNVIRVVCSLLSTVAKKADRLLVRRLNSRLARQTGRAVGQGAQGLTDGLALASELKLNEWMKLDKEARTAVMRTARGEAERFLNGIWEKVLVPVRIIAGMVGITIPESTAPTSGSGTGSNQPAPKGLERGNHVMIWAILNDFERKDAGNKPEADQVRAALAAYNLQNPRMYSILIDGTVFGLVDSTKVMAACQSPDGDSVESGALDAAGTPIMVSSRRRALDLLAMEAETAVLANRKKLVATPPAPPAVTMTTTDAPKTGVEGLVDKVADAVGSLVTTEEDKERIRKESEASHRRFLEHDALLRRAELAGIWYEPYFEAIKSAWAWLVKLNERRSAWCKARAEKEVAEKAAEEAAKAARLAATTTTTTTNTPPPSGTT